MRSHYPLHYVRSQQEMEYIQLIGYYWGYRYPAIPPSVQGNRGLMLQGIGYRRMGIAVDNDSEWTYSRY